MMCVNDPVSMTSTVSQDAPLMARKRTAAGTRPSREEFPKLIFQVEPELRAALMGFCDSGELPIRYSDVLREALRDYLRRRGHWPPRTTPPPSGK